MPQFRTKQVEIEAARVWRWFGVDREGSTMLRGSPGDWLITIPGDGRLACPDQVFRRVFEPVDDHGRRMFDGIPAEQVEVEGADG